MSSHSQSSKVASHLRGLMRGVKGLTSRRNKCLELCELHQYASAQIQSNLINHRTYCSWHTNKTLNKGLQNAEKSWRTCGGLLPMARKHCVRNASTRNSATGTAQYSTVQPDEWNTPFQLPEPDIDWEFLLNKENTTSILENIKNRKGIGDIEKVIALHNQYTEAQDRKDPQADGIRRKMVSAALELPNSCHPDTMIGDESCARTVEIVGEKKVLDSSFKARNVSDLAGKGLKMLREKNLTFSTGSKTYYLEGDLARLERALVNFTLDKLVEKGFEVMSVPDLLHSGTINGCGFNTDVHTSQVYRLHDDCQSGACLAGTAEMSLAGSFMNEVLPLEETPKRVAAVSRCYRAEADSKASERGLYRVHHFTKVEMFGVTANEQGTESNELLLDFLAIERELFSTLGLHFRILDMPSQELGAPAYRKFDIEAWMDGKRIWGEISSCSNCTDYQSRRLNIKYKRKDGSLGHAHTVNGTACAVPRMITSLLEQNQQKGRRLDLPEALHPYMDGQTHLAFNLKNFPYTYIKSLRQT